MDFIEGLPRSARKDVIFVVVDRVSKYNHFMALSHPSSTRDVTKLFMDHAFQLHGMLTTSASDREIRSSLTPFGILFLSCKKLNCA